MTRCRSTEADRRVVPVVVVWLVLAFTAPAVASEGGAEAAAPAYRRTAGVAGNLNSIGSDTLNNLMTLWAEGFQRFYPNVRVQIDGKGSSTAPPALTRGTAQLGPMSRPMKSSESADFDGRFGYEPTAVRVAVDAIAIYVHRDNPLESLTLRQVDAIFSATRSCSHQAPIDRWGQLGLDGSWRRRPISLYGRNAASGTNGYFKSAALCGGDFRDRVKEQPGSATVVQAISEDPSGIGYGGIGYRTSGVKPLSLASGPGGQPVSTAPDRVLRGNYPLARYLYVYVNRHPERPMEPAARQFLLYALSAEGQAMVVKDGYVPLPGDVLAQERARLAPVRRDDPAAPSP